MKRQPYKVDPTRTLTIRNTFAREARGRFRKVKHLITEALVDDIALGDLSAEARAKRLNTFAVPRRAFDFPRSDAKVAAFMAWLREQNEREILQTHIEPGRIMGSADQRWSNIYVDSAYAQGIRRARQEMRRSGFKVPPDPSLFESFNQPIHADRLGLIHTRVYSGLRGITEEMDKQISDILTIGLAEGRGQASIARDLALRVDGIGINRAHALARTEVIRAHHLANIQEYRSFGIQGVKVLVEWTTARDSSVCPRCSALAGKKFTIDEIESMIPLHPNCRCVAIPVLDD